mgnify:CR=1 FL=1
MVERVSVCVGMVEGGDVGVGGAGSVYERAGVHCRGLSKGSVCSGKGPTRACTDVCRLRQEGSATGAVQEQRQQKCERVSRGVVLRPDPDSVGDLNQTYLVHDVQLDSELKQQVGGRQGARLCQRTCWCVCCQERTGVEQTTADADQTSSTCNCKAQRRHLCMVPALFTIC